MAQLVLNLDWYNQLILLTLVLYGVPYGIPNLTKYLVGYATKQVVIQNNLGKFLDFLFHLGIIYQVVFVFEIV